MSAACWSPKAAASLVLCLVTAISSAGQKPVESPTPSVRPHAAQTHGALPWVSITWEELLLESRREQRPVLVYLWADASRWCRRLEAEALSDPKLAKALEGVLLWNADAQAGSGQQLAERFATKNYPVLILFDGQGRALDRLDGYLTKEDLLAEIARVMRNQETALDLAHKLQLHPDDLDLRTRYACKLELLGDFPGRDAQIEQIRKRDRTRTSLPMRREVLAERMAQIQEHFDSTREINPGPLVRFLEEERHPELLFEGYTTLAALHRQRAEELEQAQQLQVARSKRADLRATLILAAGYVPKNAALQLEFAIETVSTFIRVPKELTEVDKAFLIRLSAGAVALAPEEARAQVAAGLAAFYSGDKPNAAIALRRAAELEPDNQEWPALIASLGL
ncbi:MAG TPA: thioredoxin family protein [Planctomycetota bacterium]|nr:thioredoxin family protein [Planctomycetota bacterium]